MATALVIMLREGFEAALIVAIVLAYLRRIGRPDAARWVWLGVGLAAALAVGIGVAIQMTIDSLEGDARLRAFAVLSFAAAGVLTWMVFWMRRQSRGIKGELEAKAAAALEPGHAGRRGLVLVALLAVLREGIEASLFLLAAAIEAPTGRVVAGGLLGLALAVGLAALVYLGGKALPLKPFFTVTGLILIVFAAGLLSRGVLYLQMAGDLGSFNLNGVYDLRSAAWLTQSTESGRFLSALFGWDPRPSVEQVVVWLGYLAPVTLLFLRPHRLPALRPQPAPAPA